MSGPTRPAQVSVVVPTLARASLDACLRSISACRPAPREVIVVVQGAGDRLDELAGRAEPTALRILHDEGRGVARSTNTGIRAAVCDIVAVTHDDCTVAPDWIGQAVAHAQRHREAILTGRVLPAGDPSRVPSCKTDERPHDFTGSLEPGALYPNNMVLPRQPVMDAGGFDERFTPEAAAEDCDFAYRWLREGHSIRFEPDLVVHHHDWRTDAELDDLYQRYAFGLGVVYGKQIRARDPRVLRFVARDLRTSARAVAARRRGATPPSDWTRALPGGLVRGIAHGIRRFPPA